MIYVSKNMQENEIEQLIGNLFIFIAATAILFPILTWVGNWLLARLSFALGTVLLLGCYVLYELIMPSYMNIRVDLFLLYPLIVAHIAVSTWAIHWKFGRMMRKLQAHLPITASQYP